MTEDPSKRQDQVQTEARGGALGFGFRPTEWLVLCRGELGRDRPWDAQQVVPFGSFDWSPAAAFASYGLGVFEGLKVFRTQSGAAALFRAQDHGRRFAASARRLCLLPIEPGRFVEMVHSAARANLDALPTDPGSALYLRPLLLADEPMLGLRPPSRFLAYVYASPVGEILGEARGLRLRLVDQARVVPGGSGAAKAVGNYAAGLELKTRWLGAGYDEVLYRDGRDPACLAETSGSNIFFRFGEDRLVTPALSDQILPGITRDSVIRLAVEKLGMGVEERAVTVREALDDAAEAFVTGTGWGVRSVARLEGAQQGRDFPSSRAARALAELLHRIRTGREAGPDGWVEEV